jgi:transcriptional regulator with GAF, ATPase, and Fis domain
MRDLLLFVWGIVGRHLELSEVLDRSCPRLAAALGLRLVAVRTIDAAASSVETAAWSAAPGAPPLSRSELTPEALETVVGWCRNGTAVRGRAAAASLGVDALLPADLTGDLVLVPLRPGEDPAGASRGAVLIAVSSSPSGFDSRQLDTIESLGEPFAAAAEGHERLSELRALREAAEADNRALLARLGRSTVGDVIVGMEGGLRPVLQRLEKVARSDVPVLIFGETGTGKEVIARAIHARSPRASGPMIRVNCGAIPPELVDSELFGHERGSFTGATATRRGWFERADGGTLFLDEIGELPLPAQVRLLRTLQDGRLERVGGQTSLTVHVRVVAATHRDLAGMVRDGRFREDLWYRLSVFPIELPPLRERLEDLPPLASHFALKAARRLGLAPALPTPEDLRLLSAYAWPGNVRELSNVIERAAILGDGRRLEVAAALGHGATPRPGPGPASASRAVEHVATVAHGLDAPSVGSLERAMASHIEAALAATLGRIEGPFGAARRLELNPHTLRARMRKLGIDWRRFRLPPARRR